VTFNSYMSGKFPMSRAVRCNVESVIEQFFFSTALPPRPGWMAVDPGRTGLDLAARPAQLRTPCTIRPDVNSIKSRPIRRGAPPHLARLSGPLHAAPPKIIPQFCFRIRLRPAPAADGTRCAARCHWAFPSTGSHLQPVRSPSYQGRNLCTTISSPSAARRVLLGKSHSSIASSFSESRLRAQDGYPSTGPGGSAVTPCAAGAPV